MMAEITKQKDSDWGADQIKELENEILPMVNEFIGSKK
jgi:hypothetical protein